MVLIAPPPLTTSTGDVGQGRPRDGYLIAQVIEGVNSVTFGELGALTDYWKDAANQHAWHWIFVGKICILNKTFIVYSIDKQ